MIDRLGRNIQYARLSLTQRCNLKCVYCNPDGEHCPQNTELCVQDWIRIVDALVHLGVRKIRLTGGEPLVRKDLEEIIHGIAQFPQIEDLCMTTNAQHLPGRVELLKRAGLGRLNISIDSLKPERFRTITGGGRIEDVLESIDMAIALQLLPIKLNTVVVRGQNDDEIDDFIALTRERPIEVRFIELMPIGRLGQDESMRISNDELIRQRPYLKPLKPVYESQPSRDYGIEGHLGKVGFISPISHQFCDRCNRIRITSDGKFKPCLGDNGEVSLMQALKSGDDALLYRTLYDAIYNKPQGHHFGEGFTSVRNMSRIGG